MAAIAVYEANPDTMYAMGEGFFRSTDAGLNWMRISGLGTDYGAVKVARINSQILFASSFGRSSGNDISISSDGGLTWKWIFIGRLYAAPVVELDPVDDSTLYVGEGPSFIERTTDLGITWQALYPPAIGGLSSLAIARDSGKTLYAACTDGVFKSVDSGSTWKSISLGVPITSTVLLRLDKRNDSILYAAVDSYEPSNMGFYRSMDEGSTWQKSHIGGLDTVNQYFTVLYADPTTSGLIFLGVGSINDTLIYMSDDTGRTWMPWSEGLPDSGGALCIEYNPKSKTVFLGVGAWEGDGLYYRDTETSVTEGEPKVPAVFELFQNYPNPFNPVTKISYTLAKASYVRLKVYNVLGEEVASLEDGHMQAGAYSAEFDGSKLASGMYFYRLTAGEFTEVKKMILMK
jgi:photosystem II stability/assembly factor-like uncharacterized protein